MAIFDMKDRIEPNLFLVSRMVGDQALLLDPKADEIQLLNEVGSFIWSKIIEKRHSISDILKAIIASFEIDIENAQKDLMAFLNLLESKNMIKRVANPTENLIDSSVAFELEKGKSR
jgi:hypothetical protein